MEYFLKSKSKVSREECIRLTITSLSLTDASISGVDILRYPQSTQLRETRQLSLYLSSTFFSFPAHPRWASFEWSSSSRYSTLFPPSSLLNPHLPYIPLTLLVRPLFSLILSIGLFYSQPSPRNVEFRDVFNIFPNLEVPESVLISQLRLEKRFWNLLN